LATVTSQGRASLIPADSVSRASIVGHWRRPAILAIISLVAVLVSFRQTLLAMGSTWYSSRTFSHGFLIFPLFLYLIWVRRERILALRPSPNYWGLPLLGVLALVWLLGNLGEIKVVQELALLAILVALVWTLLGTAVVRALRFPLAFLFFAVPFGQSLISPLQDFTAWFAVNALTLSHVPVVLENRTLSLPTGNWTVAEACSGIRYLISSVVLGLIYASIVYRSRKRQVIFVVASIAVPIVANGLRAYGIILLSYLTNNKIAAGVDHIVYGWLFFTAVQLALFGVGLKWQESPTHADRIISAHPDDVAALPTEYVPSTKAALVVAIAAVVLMGLTPPIAAHLWNRAPAFAGWLESEPNVSLPWQPAATYDTTWAPDLSDTDKEVSRSYKAGVRRVDLYLALYSPRHGMKLVGNYNSVANPRLWSGVADSFKDAVIDGQTVRVHQTLLDSNLASRLVWTWYWVGGEYTANPRRAKFLQTKSRLLGKPVTAAVIALAADYQMEPAEGERILRDFLSHTSLSAAFQVPSR
jgi:exosortase A